MSDPWSFGWTQLLTVAGLLITLGIAVAGFRTFGRWKREKLEERRIEIALDALAAAYKSKFVFQMIRSALIEGYEWDDMPEGWARKDDPRRSKIGAYWAVLRRVNANKDFFDHVWDLQPRCMAIFGPEVESMFLELHKARRSIEVAATMLAQDAARDDLVQGGAGDRELYKQLRADLTGFNVDTKEGDRVGRMLDTFRNGLEARCRPIIDREFKIEPAERALQGK